MSLLVSETAANTANNTNNKNETKLEPITWPFKQQPFDFKLALDNATTSNNNNNNDDSSQQQNVSKRNNPAVHQHTLGNSKKTKLTSNSTSSNANNTTNSTNNNNTTNESNHLNTILITESYSILKIKCKCIHILNRLICLVL